MLKVLFGRPERNCAGVSRRNFLQVGSLGLGGLTLPGLLATRGAAESQTVSKDTSVVWLWLNGGPTHIETFDPKMTAPAEFRSVTGEVKTAVPGVTLGGNFSGLARQADKMAFVRSFSVPSSSHNRAAFWVNTGHAHDAKHPSLGSIASRVRGPNHTVSGMPTYIKMGQIGFNTEVQRIPGPAWLGKAYAPFGPSGPARENMNLTTKVARLEDRRSLLKKLDQLRRETDASGIMQGIDGLNQQALNLILGKATQAFDLAKENPAVVAKYGDGLGASLLTARRLCEAGCGFVAVSLQGWDMHGNVRGGMNKRGPQVDRAVSAFVEDIYQRGLDRNILLVVSGEFGRTPRINKRAGRDHWGRLSTLALSGGGLEVGQIIGESSPKAESPKSGLVTPQDLMATVFHVLGIAPDTHFEDPSGRPTPMLGGGKPINGLV
ncbi:MAG: DUF1501 domain-containing protein [Planctomycetaceae bacterium]|jgi:hypothetical protein|nr:DUF1501 domain-containing protein [Planctomycetaceae bacterium]MBT6488084.1 DUF1501 domain-containing protein [Planctomycetaceae bacterium]MBT6495287.1 DUF1501 domain-containing protein [Planctomycetaceae bacterium]